MRTKLQKRAVTEALKWAKEQALKKSATEAKKPNRDMKKIALYDEILFGLMLLYRLKEVQKAVKTHKMDKNHAL